MPNPYQFYTKSIQYDVRGLQQPLYIFLKVYIIYRSLIQYNGYGNLSIGIHLYPFVVSQLVYARLVFESVFSEHIFVFEQMF